MQYDTVETILYEPANEFVEKLLGHDRNIKALVLKKNRDYIKKTGYVTCLENETGKDYQKDARQSGATFDYPRRRCDLSRPVYSGTT